MEDKKLSQTPEQSLKGVTNVGLEEFLVAIMSGMGCEGEEVALEMFEAKKNKELDNQAIS